MRYIIREGTVRGQGRYWTGTPGRLWSDDPGDAWRFASSVLARSGTDQYQACVVRLATKAERAVCAERAAIVKELRAVARGPALVMSAREAQLGAACEARILELADRIERGERDT